MLDLSARGVIPGPGEEAEAFWRRAESLIGGAPPDLLGGAPFAWVEVVEGGRGLMPWHGAVTEIGEGVRVRVRRRVWFYSREELLAHEMAHVGRMAFDEPKFEEIIAYRTSRNAFRRYFGPIVQSNWEVLLFLGTLWWPWAAAGVLGLGLFRLWRRQSIFSRCLKALEAVSDDPEAVAYRLTDAEIVALSRGKSLSSMKKNCLRWQTISACIHPEFL